MGLRKCGGWDEGDFNPAPCRVGNERDDETKGQEQPRVVHEALE